jgi:hypothetical protein
MCVSHLYVCNCERVMLVHVCVGVHVYMCVIMCV